MICRHYIFISSSYSLGTRIGLHFTNEKKLEEYSKKLNNELNSQSYSLYSVEIEGSSLEDLVEYDYFYSGIEFFDDVDKFIKCIKKDKDISVVDLAKYILAYFQKNREKCSHIKLQKLVYLCYREYLIKMHSSLFKEKIYAWRYGPVVEDLYTEIKNSSGQDFEYNPENHFIKSTVENSVIQYRILFAENGIEKKTIIDETISKYGSLSPKKLVDLTHSKNSPWYEVFYSKDNTLITDDIIIKNYKNEV